jgi:FAD binding domain
MAARSVLIVGAGPAGAALAYLLARRGVAVTLLEKHLDFARAFRGEGLQPSGVDALVQMVVGTDGRHSIMRKQGRFTELTVRQNFDVVWSKVPFPDFWPDRATVRLELGPGYRSGGVPSSDGQGPAGRDGALHCRFVAFADSHLGRRQTQALRARSERRVSQIPFAASHTAARVERAHEIVLRAERAGAIAARAEVRS